MIKEVLKVKTNHYIGDLYRNFIFYIYKICRFKDEFKNQSNFNKLDLFLKRESKNNRILHEKLVIIIII